MWCFIFATLSERLGVAGGTSVDSKSDSLACVFFLWCERRFHLAARVDVRGEWEASAGHTEGTVATRWRTTKPWDIGPIFIEQFYSDVGLRKTSLTIRWRCWRQVPELPGALCKSWEPTRWVFAVTGQMHGRGVAVRCPEHLCGLVLTVHSERFF